MDNIQNISPAKWLVVVNPNAGSRKGQKDWPKIKKLINAQGLEHDVVFTQNRTHAIQLCAEKVTAGYRKIIVVGGDGTLNEVINGILFQEACESKDVVVGLIPVGTGNDWGRTYSLPGKYPKAIEVIKQGYIFRQDAGSASYFDEEGEQQRYFVNVSGMGYDALVARKTNRMKDKGRGNPLAYLINIFTGLFQYKYTSYNISVDGKEMLKGRVLSMNVGICKYNGGGLKQVPNAIPDDGLLDVTVIKATSRLNLFKHIAKLYDGSFIKLRFVETYRGESCRIISKARGSIFMEADGESLGHSPLSFSVIPRALSLIIPEPEEDK